MKVIGLTGSIGMGKSFVANIFRQKNIDVFDADAQVHEILESDINAQNEIKRLFPEAVGNDGNINRGNLGRLVFTDEDKLKILESILHPIVKKRGDDFYQKSLESGMDIIVQDIPLLFETGADKTCHFVIVVKAPSETQDERVLSRDNITKEQYEQIKKIQLQSEEKEKLADYVIDSNDSKENIEKIVQNIIEDIKVKSI